MDEPVTEGDPRFLDIIRIDFPEVADALLVPRLENRDQVRAILKPLSRERLESLTAFSLTFLLQVMSLERLANDARIEGYEYREKTYRLARKIGAANKLARDPRQRAKAEAFKLWQERRAGKHPRLRTNEQFAIECMRRWPALRSAAVITGWCTAWTKAAKGRKTQSAS